MGTRYNDVVHLKRWSTGGGHPRIHDDIYNLIMQTIEAEALIDMCCAIGLLGTHVQESLGATVIGVEADKTNRERAATYGVPIPMVPLFIDRSTIGTFADLIREHSVTGILARRCISELFGNTPDKKVDWEWTKIFSGAIADAGVTEIWIEGRADQGRSVHPVPDTATEVACLESRFEVAERYRNCAYLRAT